MKQAQKDAKKIASSGLKPKVLQLIKIIEKNPLQYPPDYELLKGDMQGLISRRTSKRTLLTYKSKNFLNSSQNYLNFFYAFTRLYLVMAIGRLVNGFRLGSL